VALLGTPWAASAQDDDPFRPGLVATFSDAQGGTYQRVDRRVSFVWGSRPPHPRLAADDFSARWKGRLRSESPGKYQLSAFVCGNLQVRLADKVLLDVDAEVPSWHDAEPVELSFDRHPLEILFRKSGEHARLSLFWSGPGFQLEPIGTRWLLHDADKTPPANDQRGEALTRALRCATCHDLPGEPEPDRAPSLERLAGNISAAWLVDWLTDDEQYDENNKQEADGTALRRMPSFNLPREDATAIAAFLLQDDKNKQPKPANNPTDEEVQAGEELILTLGCLACHQCGELGESGLFAGGDLSRIADKRPAEFFALWLAEPARINRHHRMPVFELTSEERLIGNLISSTRTDSSE